MDKQVHNYFDLLMDGWGNGLLVWLELHLCCRLQISSSLNSVSRPKSLLFTINFDVTVNHHGSWRLFRFLFRLTDVICLLTAWQGWLIEIDVSFTAHVHSLQKKKSSGSVSVFPKQDHNELRPLVFLI
jgi:hypothetical protein